MGGDDGKHSDSLIDQLKICKERGFKTALYSGFTYEELDKRLLKYLDYVKVGPYIEFMGALNNCKTNQRLYTVTDGCVQEDITAKFWRHLDEYYN